MSNLRAMEPGVRSETPPAWPVMRTNGCRLVILAGIDVVFVRRLPIQADLEPLPGFSVDLGRYSGGIALLNPRLPSWAPPGQSFVKPEVVGDGDAGWTNRSSQTGRDLRRNEIPDLEHGTTVAPCVAFDGMNAMHRSSPVPTG